MKNIIKIAILGILSTGFNIFSQNNNIENSVLIGKWKIEKIEINNVLTAEKGKSPNLSDTTSTPSQNLINGFAKAISDNYLNSIFYFKANNKLKIKARKRRIKGTYIYQKEDGLIVTDLEHFKKLYIYKFENNILTINKVDDNEVISFTLIKK